MISEWYFGTYIYLLYLYPFKRACLSYTNDKNHVCLSCHTPIFFYLRFLHCLSSFFYIYKCCKCNTVPLNWITKQLMLFLSKNIFHVNVSVFLRIAGQISRCAIALLCCRPIHSRATLAQRNKRIRNLATNGRAQSCPRSITHSLIGALNHQVIRLSSSEILYSV